MCNIINFLAKSYLVPGFVLTAIHLGEINTRSSDERYLTSGS